MTSCTCTLPGCGLPVDVAGLGGGAEDAGGERVGAARPDEDAVGVVDGGEEDLAVAGRPHRASPSSPAATAASRTSSAAVRRCARRACASVSSVALIAVIVGVSWTMPR